MAIKPLEDLWDALMDKLLGNDLAKIQARDPEFSEHIEINWMSAWIPFISFGFAAFLVVIVKYAILEHNNPEMSLVAAMVPQRATLMHTIPLMVFSAGFAYIWRSVFHKYAAKFHSDQLKARNTKFFAIAASFFAILAFNIALFADYRFYDFMIILYFISFLAAFSCALVFSSMMYHLVRKAAQLEATTQQDERDDAHQRYPALAHLTLGWCGTNLLTAVVLLILVTFQLSFVVADNVFHDFFANGEDGLTISKNGAFGQIVALEIVLLLSFLLMGFFSGTFRRKANAEQFKAELVRLNTVVGRDVNGPGQPQPPSSGKDEKGTPTKQGELPVGSARAIQMQLYGAIQSSRFVSSALVAGLHYAITFDFASSATVLFFFLSSYLFNDLEDYQSGRDFLSHPNRPLPSGRLAVPVSAALTLLFFIFGFASAASQGGSLLWVLSCCYLVSFGYSKFLKRLFPLFATPLWCSATIALFLHATEASIVAYALSFCAVFGRELLLEKRDAEADKYFAIIPTYPEVLGAKISAVAMVLVFGAILGTLFTVWSPIAALTCTIATVCLGVALFAKSDIALRRYSKSIYLLIIALPV